MARYECSVCGYVYDEQQEGKTWEGLAATWTCHVCGSAKSVFHPVGRAGDSALGLSKAFVAAHRVFGYGFLALYLFFLWQMAPRT